MGENGGNLVGRIVGIPGEAAIEPQPVGIRIFHRKRPVAIDADHAQLLIFRRALAGTVDPGERTSRRAASQRTVVDKRCGDAAPRKMDGGGNPEDAAADDDDR